MSANLFGPVIDFSQASSCTGVQAHKNALHSRPSWLLFSLCKISGS